jgi:hypothetical protein
VYFLFSKTISSATSKATQLFSTISISTVCEQLQIEAELKENSSRKIVLIMWPLKLDMSKEECRGVLRRLGKESKKSAIFFRKTKKTQIYILVPLIHRIGGLFERHEHLPSARKLGQQQTECVRSAETLLAHFRRSPQSGSSKSRKQ